jgi:hypothetical protein
MPPGPDAGAMGGAMDSPMGGAMDGAMSGPMDGAMGGPMDGASGELGRSGGRPGRPQTGRWVRRGRKIVIMGA